MPTLAPVEMEYSLMRRLAYAALFIGLALTLSACPKSGPQPVDVTRVKKSPSNDIPGWGEATATGVMPPK